MKVQLIATLFITSFFLSILNTDDYEQFFPEDYNPLELQVIESSCGVETFSKAVKNAFLRESNINQHTPQQIYSAKEWVIVLESNYCNTHLEHIINSSNVVSYHYSSIVSGTWIIEFQSGYSAFEYISELYSKGYVWIFYPIIEQQFNRLTDLNNMGKDFKFFIVSS